MRMSYQTYQTYIEINASAIHHNIECYKKFIGSFNKLAIVIKGNGYGHGLIPMGLLCNENNLVDLICVANLSEALELDSHQVYKPILILGYSDTDPTAAIGKNFIFMIDSLAYAKQLNEIAERNRSQFLVHIKVDTGLSRLGVFPENFIVFISAVQQLSHLQIDGIFSHFIASDKKKLLTEQQMDIFVNCVKKINGVKVPLIHMSNTMSISRLQYPSIINSFRVGLGIYGFGAAELNLKIALTWKTHIVSIKTVAATQSISYGPDYYTKKTTIVGIIPIGYCDGYQLRFSNKVTVTINELQAPVVGRIGMNMAMIDITNCSAQIGDEVTIFGSEKNNNPNSLALAVGIQNVREILVGINPKIPRIIKNK